MKMRAKQILEMSSKNRRWQCEIAATLDVLSWLPDLPISFGKTRLQFLEIPNSWQLSMIWWHGIVTSSHLMPSILPWRGVIPTELSFLGDLRLLRVIRVLRVARILQKSRSLRLGSTEGVRNRIASPYQIHFYFWLFLCMINIIYIHMYIYIFIFMYRDIHICIYIYVILSI